ncbi:MULTISPECIES: GDSL-type esterase/lipase family protein [Streptomycetaceae]|nr:MULTISPECIES: GDSL-type esterase/lipase family protein [Streptomycetaceae]MYS58554.1 hypothetical protein [Streptomyces sp. SID5468]CCB74220.1 putative lipoprotein [Streptantibioticus cattleyicolor NRRL 8057 = DSM 46488]
MRQPCSRPRTAATAALTAVTTAAAVFTLAGCGNTAARPQHAAGPAATRSAPNASGPATSTAPADTAWDPHPRSIAALGDSITRGFDACSLLEDCPDASWVTGNRPDVKSLTYRLLMGDQSRSWNLAVTGARVADLPRQAAAAARHRPALVTVLVGANDACRPTTAAMTPVGTFRRDFTEAIRTLRRTSPSTEVYVASIPDLARLWAAGQGNAAAQKVWKLGICPSMLAADAPGEAPQAAQARRTAVRERVIAYNTALRDACAGLPRCRYDAGTVFAQPFTRSDLSPWDWFHPGVPGQARLAQLAYTAITRP